MNAVLAPARPVPPRLALAPRGYARETLLLLHPPRLAMVLGLCLAGAFLAPRVEAARLGAELAMVALGVGLGAYRLDELKDRTTAPSIPAAHHRALAALGVLGCAAIGAWMAWALSPWLLLPLAAALLGIVGYNTIPALHTPGVYALTWGFLPVAASQSLQTLAWPTWEALAAGALAGALALEHVRTWGLRRCGRGPACAKPQNALRGANGPCHSASITCATRLTMPDELNEHAKGLLRLQYAMAAALVAWAVLGHAGL